MGLFLQVGIEGLKCDCCGKILLGDVQLFERNYDNIQLVLYAISQGWYVKYSDILIIGDKGPYVYCDEHKCFGEERFGPMLKKVVIK